MSAKSLTDGQVKAFIWSFTIVITGLILLYAIAAPVNAVTWDALSYLFPCAGGIAAGAGFYFNKKNKPASPTASAIIPLKQAKPAQQIAPEESANPVQDSESVAVEACAVDPILQAAAGKTSISPKEKNDKFFYGSSIFFLFLGLFFFAFGHECRDPALSIIFFGFIFVVYSSFVYNVAHDIEDNSWIGAFLSVILGALVLFVVLALLFFIRDMFHIVKHHLVCKLNS
jgi:hypothetical protein